MACDGTAVNYGTIVDYCESTNMGDSGDNVTKGSGMVSFGDGLHCSELWHRMGDWGDDGTESAGYGDGTECVGHIW